jgi:hypothetical protein
MARTLIEVIGDNIRAQKSKPTKAAAAGGMMPSTNNSGAGMVGLYYSYVEGEQRQKCMSIPTVSRARDLMASVLGCMSLKMYSELWNGNEMEKIPLAPRTWLRRIDPSVPNNFLLSFLFDDLFFYGRSFLYVKQARLMGFLHRLLDYLQQWCKH